MIWIWAADRLRKKICGSWKSKMAELAKQNEVYRRKEISKADAISYFSEKGDEYKLDLLENLKDGEITFYTQGNFTDLCRGPHIPQYRIYQSDQADQYCRGLLER